MHCVISDKVPFTKPWMSSQKRKERERIREWCSVNLVREIEISAWSLHFGYCPPWLGAFSRDFLGNFCLSLLATLWHERKVWKEAKPWWSPELLIPFPGSENQVEFLLLWSSTLWIFYGPSSSMHCESGTLWKNGEVGLSLKKETSFATSGRNRKRFFVFFPCLISRLGAKSRSGLPYIQPE